jgi:hypothetical protein
MKSFKFITTLLFLFACSSLLKAQDAVVIDSGNFVRGTIQGTDYTTVTLLKDDKSVSVYNAKDVKEFMWNGENFVSKPLFFKKKMESRFFKVVEIGAVNLYALGGNTGASEPKKARNRIRPSFGLGLGTGGFGGGGLGVGGGITIGGGGGRRNSDQDADQGSRTLYYIEKPGSGPLQFIAMDGRNSDTEKTRTLLLQKLTNDEDLAEKIRDADGFDARNIKAFVNAYNSMQK